jgi:hypothetical protein
LQRQRDEERLKQQQNERDQQAMRADEARRQHDELGAQANRRREQPKVQNVRLKDRDEIGGRPPSAMSNVPQREARLPERAGQDELQRKEADLDAFHEQSVRKLESNRDHNYEGRDPSGWILAPEAPPPIAARPAMNLTGLAGADVVSPAGSSDARDSFGSSQNVSDAARAADREVIRNLADELFGQTRRGENVDLREAARAGIAAHLNAMKEDSVSAADAALRSLISRLPDDARFDAQTYYSTFISPETSMLTPGRARRNTQKYFEKMVGQKLDEFFSGPPER